MLSKHSVRPDVQLEWAVAPIIAPEDYPRELVRREIPYSLLKKTMEEYSGANENAQVYTEEGSYINAQLTQYRCSVEDALCGLYNLVINRFLPNGPVLEVGCGANAFVYSHLLNDFDQERWWMVEINKLAIESLHANPDFRSRATEGSGYDLLEVFPEIQFQTIVGNSSYDSMSELDVAMRAAYERLPSGGRFMHIQDVYPSGHVINTIRYKDLLHRNLEEPTTVLTYPDRLDPIYVENDGEFALASKYLHDHMHVMGEQAGFRVLYNDTATYLLEETERDKGCHESPYNLFEWSYLAPVSKLVMPNELAQNIKDISEVEASERVAEKVSLVLLIMEKP